jgi:peptidyl-prolyl cis-trans isomerase D
MFEFIRNHQRLMQFLLLVLIVPPFAFFGIDGYKRFTDDATGVAKVGGYMITQQEYAQAQREQMERQREIARSMNIPFDAAMMDTPAARAAVLDTLVNQRALSTFAIKQGIAVTDDRLRDVILAIPAVQEGGQFNKERYTRLLAAQGLTPEMFESRLRQDLSLQAINTGVGESAFAPRALQAMVARAQGEEREVQELVIKADAFAADVKIAPDAVRAYYDKNPNEFTQLAQVKAEYTVLSIDAIAAGIAPPAAEIKAFYEQNIARYRQEEQREASHILIKFEEKSDRAALRAKAEDVLKQARAAGADFAALARKFSQDTGSAAQGGALGSFGRGAMVKPFEEAVFAMKAGEISNIVESDFGYHIIKLTGVKPGSVRSLDDVRAEIEKEWSKREAQKRFSESAEGFTNTVYEQADSLKPAVDKYKLKLETTGSFSRATAPKELNNPKLLERLFSEDAVKSRRNVEATEVAPGRLMSARVVDYKPQAIRPFEEVQAAIGTELARKEALAKARADGEARLAAAQKAADGAGFGVARTVSRTKYEGFGPDAMRAIMSAPTAKLPVVVGAQVNGGYALYRIIKVSESASAVEPTRAAAVKSALDRAQAEAEFGAYLESIRKAAKVVTFKENLDIKKGN